MTDRPGPDTARPSRRAYLAGLATTGGAGLAGCQGLFETQSVDQPALVEDRPDAVYVPTHTEGMYMVGRAELGRLRMALSYSFSHPMWLADGDELTHVPIEDADDAHLMVNVWDEETGMVIPASNPTLTIRKDGDPVIEGRSMWRMLSQRMGIHFGDNVALTGDGTYAVTVQYGPVETRKTGVFQGAFEEQFEEIFTMEFNQSTLENLPYENLPDRQGQEDAVDPMQMGSLPVPQLRPAEDMPGTIGTQGTSADAVFVARVLEERPEGIEGSGPYLYVSARTPYHQYPLSNFSLDATLGRDGESVFEGQLTATLSPTLDYHYGAAVEGAEAGDSLTITPLLPPQVSRHEGYETAFLDFSPLELTLESL